MMSPQKKTLFLLMILCSCVRTYQQENSTNTSEEGPTGDQTQPQPDLPSTMGRKKNSLPPLPSDRQLEPEPLLPGTDGAPPPAQTPAPSPVPFPGVPQPFPLPPDIQVEPPIQPGYFCDANPTIPIPAARGCPTCQGQCGKTVCPNIQCGVEQRFCSCDSLCKFFNDCCEGFDLHCPTEHRKATEIQGTVDKFNGKVDECVGIRTPRSDGTSDVHIKTPMISMCPDGSQCPGSADKWEPQTDLNDNIPVMEPRTGLHFVSYACAKCNGVTDVIPWKIKFEVFAPLMLEHPDKNFPKKKFDNITLIRYRQDYDVLISFFYSGAIFIPDVTVYPPQQAGPLRRCPIYTVVDKCAETCTDNTELVRLCENSPTTYTTIRFEAFGFRAYRNYYCALCAWNDNMKMYASPFFENDLICGSKPIALSHVAGSPVTTVIELGFQFNTDYGLFLPNKTMDYCELEPTKLMPEPTGCPTCQGRCGKTSQLFPDTNRMFCSCDKLCLFYNDCCERFATYCPMEWEEGLEIVQNLTAYKGIPECFPTRVWGKMIETPMIYKCGDEEETSCTDVLKYHDVKRFNIRENVGDYLPVTDPHTGLHYASAECARCNNISKVNPWGMTVDVDNRSQWNRAREDGSPPSRQIHLGTDLGTLLNESFFHPVVTFYPPGDVPLRHCYHGYSGSFPQIKVYDKCPDSCQNQDLRDLCENSHTIYSKFRYAPYENFRHRWKRQDPTFRNFYCALCNWDRTLEQMYGSDTQSLIICGGAGKPPSGGNSQNLGTLSLTVVFDFNFQLGEQVGHTGTGDEEINRVTDELDLQILGIITLVCMGISIICLLIRIGFQCCVPHFWSLAGKMQVQLAVALFIAFVFVLIGAFVEKYHDLCYFTSVIKNFGFLATFAWMSVISFVTWRIFGTDSIKHKTSIGGYFLLKISIVAWLVPSVLTAFAVMMDFVGADNSFSPAFALNLCWYNQRYALLMYFGIPIAICLIANIILFVLTAIQLRKAFRNSKAVSKQEQKNFQVYVRLFLLMGITWVLGFVAPFINHIVINSLFVILNALQGLFLFVAFVCQKKIWDFLTMKSHQRDGSTSNPSSGSSSSNTRYKTTSTDLKSEVKRKSNVGLTRM